MTTQQATPRPAITLDNLTVSYRQHPALHHISGQFAHGSLTAVMGPNGSGKSTLLKSLVGLLPRMGGDPGALTLQPEPLRMAYLPQVSEIDRSFPMDVCDCVLHDEAQARQHFPQALLLARELVAWGPTGEVLTPANLQRARAMAEAWDESAELCEVDA
jgi:ABC-type Mn2+/Zn2+ transport system ATPase subunit